MLVLDDHAAGDRLFIDAFGDHLTICTTIADLEERLLAGAPWDVAFVDFALTGLGQPSDDLRTGLSALRILRDKSPRTKLVSYTQPGESGRQLYMAAAKRWFAADATLAKSAMTVESVRSFVYHLQAGRDPSTVHLRRWLESAHLIDRLLKNENYVTLWRYWHELNGNEGAIADMAYLTKSQVRHFKEMTFEAVLDFKERFEGVDLRGTGGGNTNYKGVLGAFASENRIFFAATDLADAIQQRPRPSRD